MKITKNTLKKMIKEELAIANRGADRGPAADYGEDKQRAIAAGMLEVLDELIVSAPKAKRELLDALTDEDYGDKSGLYYSSGQFFSAVARAAYKLVEYTNR